MRWFRERRRKKDRRATDRQTGGRRTYDRGTKSTLLGLDWRGRTLRFVELEHFRNTYYLLRAGKWDLPLARNYSSLMSEVDRHRVSESINEMIASHGIVSKNVVLALGSSIAKIKGILVDPSWDDQQINDEVTGKISEWIGQPIDNYCIDYHIVPDEEGKPSRVIVGAAEKQVVDNCCSAITQAGLNPVILDVDCFAIQNAYNLSFEPQNKSISVVAEITAEAVELVVLESSEFKVGQVLNMPKTVDEMIDQENWDASRSDMEIFSHKGDVYLSSLAKALLRRVNGLVGSVFPSTLHGGQQDIALCGTGARFPEMVSYLQSHHEGSVNVLNPFVNIKVSGSFAGEKYVFDEAPEYAIAVGLATRQEF